MVVDIAVCSDLITYQDLAVLVQPDDETWHQRPAPASSKNLR
jgi:hypothetical protein